MSVFMLLIAHKPAPASAPIVGYMLMFSALISSPSQAWQSQPYGFYPGYAQAPGHVPQAAYPTLRPVSFVSPGYPAYGRPTQYAYPGYPATPKPQTTTQPKPKKSIPTTDTQRVKATQPLPSKPVSADIASKKQAFVAMLLPAIERANSLLHQDRQRLSTLNQQLQQKKTLTSENRDWLKRLARLYRVDADPLEQQSARDELLIKVDIIPASLTLAQAANESAWGKSRFATEANNLFGIWTYDADKGLTPKQRESGKTHLVRKFDDIDEAVSYYMQMLNNHPAYKKLRELRHELRQQHKPIEGSTLAAGLDKYSAKGEQYVQLIRDLIRQNQWAALDQDAASA